mgnify:CR=1 FL=1
MAKPETHLDEHYRERFVDAGTSEARARVERALAVVDAVRLEPEVLENSDVSEKERADLGRALGKFARVARLNDEPARALDAWKEAIEIWRELGREKARFLAELEYATTCAEDESGDGEDVTTLFLSLQHRLDEDEAFSLYADFLAEHRARWHAANARFDEALACITRALELRRARGNAKHIATTEALRARIERARETDHGARA